MSPDAAARPRSRRSRGGRRCRCRRRRPARTRGGRPRPCRSRSTVIEPDVVQVGVGDRGAVDLGLHHAATHRRGSFEVGAGVPVAPGGTTPTCDRHPRLSMSRPARTGRRPAGAASPASGSGDGEGVGVDDRGVVEPRERLGRRSGRPCAAATAAGSRSPAADELGRPAAGPGAARGRPPAPRASGRRCGSTWPGRRAPGRVGQPTTSTGQRQVGGHAPDDGELLEVLLAEVGPARRRRWRTAWPPPWPRRRSGSGRLAPSKRAATSATDTVVRTGRGVHLLDRRARTRGRRRPPRPGPVSRVEVAGVGGEVLAGAELQRVDEDRWRRRRRSRPRPPPSARRGRRGGSPWSARGRPSGPRPGPRRAAARSSAMVVTTSISRLRPCSAQPLGARPTMAS